MSAVDDVAIVDATPKEQGEAVAEVVVSVIDPLEHVPDDVAEWHDARLQDVLVTGSIATLLEHVAVPADTPIEIKAAQKRISNGAGVRRGRWYIKRDAHERLLESAGHYALVVYEPGGEILELVVVPADVVDEFLAGRWTAASAAWGDADVCKVTWSRLIDAERIERRRSA